MAWAAGSLVELLDGFDGMALRAALIALEYPVLAREESIGLPACIDPVLNCCSWNSGQQRPLPRGSGEHPDGNHHLVFSFCFCSRSSSTTRASLRSA